MDFDELLIIILREMKDEMVRNQLKNLREFVNQYNLTDADARRKKSAELIVARVKLEIEIKELRKCYYHIEPELSEGNKSVFDDFFKCLYTIRDDLVKSKNGLRRK